jgi:hypothetical protein
MIKLLASSLSKTITLQKVPAFAFSNVRDALKKKLDE